MRKPGSTRSAALPPRTRSGQATSCSARTSRSSTSRRKNWARSRTATSAAGCNGLGIRSKCSRARNLTLIRPTLIVVTLACGFAIFASSAARADFRIGDACRVKGQEENILQGMGIVAGLKGTGDGDSKPTQRALAQMMEHMGNRIGASAQGTMLAELKNAKNVALVFVTAKVPPGGAQPGDFSDCTVSAVSAKSLEGGYLMISALKGPNPQDPTVYATAQGLLVVDDANLTQTARIPNGATIERE